MLTIFVIIFPEFNVCSAVSTGTDATSGDGGGLPDAGFPGELCRYRHLPAGHWYGYIQVMRIRQTHTSICSVNGAFLNICFGHLEQGSVHWIFSYNILLELLLSSPHYSITSTQLITLQDEGSYYPADNQVLQKGKFAVRSSKVNGLNQHSMNRVLTMQFGGVCVSSIVGIKLCCFKYKYYTWIELEQNK